MTEPSELADDPWAWLHDADDDDVAAPSPQGVAALIVDAGDPAAVQKTERALDELASAVRVVGIVDGAVLAADSLDVATDLDTEWLWFLPAGCLPAPASLGSLAACGASVAADVITPLLIQPRRRGLGILIEEFGQTLTMAGRVTTHAEPDERFQGQLSVRPVLGGNVTGLLVHRKTFVELGGFTPGLPGSLAGLEFGWRVNLSGRHVVADPAAQVVAPAQATELQERRWGLALAATHARRPRWTGLRLVVGCLLSALGFLLGKDTARARAELAGMAGWLRHSEDAELLRAAVRRAAPTPEALRRCQALRPGWRAAALAIADGVAERAADWFATFTERAPHVSLDDLTGDDFAPHSSRLRRASPILAGGVIVAVLAIIAARTTFGSGALAGPQLLPAPASWAALLGEYLRPLAGQPGIGAPGWLGLTAAAALLTGGNVEWLVTLVMVGCVPLAWFAAFRVLRRLLDDGRLALVGGFVFALAPALVGGLNRGMFGLALWTVLLPMLGYSLLDWAGGRGFGWRQAAETGLLLVLAVAVLPLVWLPAVLVLVVAVIRRGRAVLGQGLLAVAAPALLYVGPGWSTALAFPGRFLTGTDPALAPLAAPQPWLLLLGQAPGGGLPPLWISAAVFTVAWVAGVVGALRRPRTAGWALLGAAAAYVLAVGLTHVVVAVAPGVAARPQAQPWLVVMLAGLTVAGVLGLDGLPAELAARALGARHVAALALTVGMGSAAALGAGWWALAGESGLERGPVGAVPAFVALAQSAVAPSRTLAIDLHGSQVHWAVIADDFPRLGDGELGVAGAGDPTSMTLAADVTARLVGGSADDQVIDDLARLGVGNVWVHGGDSGVRTAIGNTPGLGIGTGDEHGYTWPVPASARAVVTTDTGRTPIGPGVWIPTGPSTRALVLAERADQRWWATLDGRPLAPATLADGRQSFALGGAGGRLDYGLDAGPAWWPWLQAAGLGGLVLLALPELRRGRRPPGRSRRVAGADA